MKRATDESGSSGFNRRDRQADIVARLRVLQTELSVEDLAREFQVTPLTIRRDLDQLEQEKLIVRTHGGCLLRTSLESAYHRQAALNFELKKAIGKAAGEELKGAKTILISDGSTTFHLAAFLPARGTLSVYTNSIAMVGELARHPEISLFILGGQFDRNLYLLGGNLTEMVLESLHFDIVFLGTDALDSDGSCFARSLTEARLTKIMLGRGRRKVLLADHTKTSAHSHAGFARLSDFDLWITTPGIPPDLLRQFRKLVEIKEVSV
jgi:DeoR family transcriptional regulator, fructose operon transcriptional repressor